MTANSHSIAFHHQPLFMHQSDDLLQNIPWKEHRRSCRRSTARRGPHPCSKNPLNQSIRPQTPPSSRSKELATAARIIRASCGEARQKRRARTQLRNKRGREISRDVPPRVESRRGMHLTRKGRQVFETENGSRSVCTMPEVDAHDWGPGPGPCAVSSRVPTVARPPATVGASRPLGNFYCSTVYGLWVHGEIVLSLC